MRTPESEGLSRGRVIRMKTERDRHRNRVKRLRSIARLDDNIYIYIYMLLARIFLTLPLHLSLSSIAFGWSSRLHILYVEISFETDVQSLHVCLKELTRERVLWAHPYFSNSFLRVLFVRFEWFSRWEVGDCIDADFRDAASRIYSIWFVAFLCCCRQALSPCA